MQDKGYLKISRHKFDEWRWTSSGMKCYVFLRLLIMANYKDTPFEKGTVKRGQLVTSINRLSQRLDISKPTLIKTLRDLQETRDIMVEQRARHSVISIVDYDAWQGVETAPPLNSAGFDEAWSAYGRKGNEQLARHQWAQLSETDRRTAAEHIPHYTRSRPAQYLTDFQSYLSTRQFMSPVYMGNAVTYDPKETANKIAGKYDPSAFLRWDGGYQAYRTHDYPWQGINDGYTDEDRPDGARVVKASTVYVWSQSEKKWNESNERRRDSQMAPPVQTSR